MNFFQKADTWLRKQNPWIGLSLFVLSTVLAIFLFFQSQERGLIAFANSTVQIYDKQASFDAISVVTRDGEKVEDKVFAVETVIANIGEISLSKDRERLPVMLSFGPDTKIIDVRISAATDPEITKFRLRRSLQDKEQQKLELAWDHFDPGHTVKVTTIVSAEDAIDPTVTGRYLGVELVKGTLEKPKTKWSQKNWKYWFNIYSPILGFGALVLFFGYVVGKNYPIEFHIKISAYLRDILTYAIMTVIIFSIIYSIYFRVSVPHLQ